MCFFYGLRLRFSVTLLSTHLIILECKGGEMEYKYIWDSVQLNHPYGTFSKFPEQAKEK